MLRSGKEGAGEYLGEVKSDILEEFLLLVVCRVPLVKSRALMWSLKLRDMAGLSSRRYYILYTLSITFWSLYLLILALKQTSVNGIESTDSYFYLKLAERTYEGVAFTDRIYSPGYSWIVSLLLRFGLDLEIAGRMVSILFSVLSIVVAFLIIRMYFGDLVAFFGCVLIGTIPQYIYYSISTLPYTTASFFLWSVSYLALVSRGRSLIIPLLAGLLGGYGYITRPENITTALVFFFLSRSILGSILFLLGFIVSSTPYHIISLYEGNMPSIISKYISYKAPYVGIAESDVVKGAKDIFRVLFSFKDYIRTLVSNIHLSHKYAIPNLISPLSLLMFGLGLGMLLKNWSDMRDKLKPFLYIFVLWMIPIFVLVIVADYMFVPVLLVFGAVSGNFFKTFNKNRTAVLFLLFVISLNLFWSARPFYSDDGRRIYRITGQWIKENLGEKLVIFEPHPFASFYADGVWTVSPKKAKVCVLTSLDYTSPRVREMLQIFLSDGDDRFHLVKKLRYGHIEAKVFVSKDLNDKVEQERTK